MSFCSKKDLPTGGCWGLWFFRHTQGSKWRSNASNAPRTRLALLEEWATPPSRKMAPVHHDTRCCLNAVVEMPCLLGRRFSTSNPADATQAAIGFLASRVQSAKQAQKFQRTHTCDAKRWCCHIPSRAEWMLEAARETTQESMIFIISLLGV